MASALEAELQIRDGENHQFYATLNEIGYIPHCILVYQLEEPIACGAIRSLDASTAEMKRVYVKPEHRGRGIAFFLLQQLEQWAEELSYQSIVLETGLNQPEAIALYNRSGYLSIEKFGKYLDSPNSVCFRKQLQ